MARRLTPAAYRRLEALEARAERLTPPTRPPLADLLAVAGVGTDDFLRHAAVLVDADATDSEAVDAGQWVSGVLERAHRRLSGLPDRPPPVPFDPEHPEPPGPGYLSDGRYWYPDGAR